MRADSLNQNVARSVHFMDDALESDNMEDL